MRRRLDGTQKEHVKAKLLAGKRLNHTDLIQDCGGKAGWRLGAIVYDLVNDKKEPWLIERAYSGANRMATYWIPKGFKPGGPVQLGLPL
jgi:hypothetical protein